MISYLHASAAMKLLVQEAESEALVARLESPDGDRRLVASWLLHTELHCAANRHPNDIEPEALSTMLDVVSLIDLTRGDLLTAGTLPERLRSNDAMHLAVALRVGADEMFTYDAELGAAASAAGLAVVQPS
ncbi:MAG: type II toxin-antitoxin system VapC family toxin [Actinomycetota bacterium]|nr:type II toxin-antitoxin system VapC family toxin [Actinomycetota bacterium]